MTNPLNQIAALPPEHIAFLAALGPMVGELVEASNRIHDSGNAWSFDGERIYAGIEEVLSAPVTYCHGSDETGEWAEYDAMFGAGEFVVLSRNAIADAAKKARE